MLTRNITFSRLQLANQLYSKNPRCPSQCMTYIFSNRIQAAFLCKNDTDLKNTLKSWVVLCTLGRAGYKFSGVFVCHVVFLNIRFNSLRSCDVL